MKTLFTMLILPILLSGLLSPIALSKTNEIDNVAVNYFVIPIVLNINNRTIDNVVFLNSNFEFESDGGGMQSLNDVLTILNSITFSEDMYFSCDGSDMLACEKYKEFKVSYNFYSSEITLFYKLDDSSQESDTDMSMIKVSNFVSGSRTKGAGGTVYDTLYVNSTLGIGLTHDSYLESTLNYDGDSIDVSEFSYNKELDSHTLSYIHSQTGGTNFNKYTFDKYDGFKISSTSNKLESVGGDSLTIYEVSNEIGLINVIDRDDKVVYTIPLNRGLNEFILSRRQVGSDVAKVDIVVNGNVVKTDEYYLGGNDFSEGYIYSFGAGVMSGKSGIKSLYLTHESQFMGLDYNMSFVDENNYLFNSLSYYVNKHLNFSVKHYSDEDDLDRKEFGVSARINYRAYNFSGSFYQTMENVNGEDRSNYTFNSSVQKNIFDKYNALLTYQTSYSDDKILSSRIGVNVNSYQRHKSFSLTWSLNTTYDFEHKDKYLGVNVSISINDGYKQLNPRIQVSKHNEQNRVRLSNQFNLHDDHLAFTPDLDIGDNDIDFGLNIRANYDDFRSDVFYNNYTDGSSVGFNMANSLYFIDKQVYSSSSDSDAAILMKHDGLYTDEVQLNNRGFGNKNIALVNSGSDIDVSSNRNELSIVEQKMIRIGKYRYAEIAITHKTDAGYFVYGRMVDEHNNSQSGISVANHIANTVSDADGYFSLNVSKEYPDLTFSHDGKVCLQLTVTDVDNQSDQFLYIGRNLCST